MKTTVEEFKKYCNILLARPNYSKKNLAENLHLDATYFSKLYNGKKPIPEHIYERLKNLASGQLPEKGESEMSKLMEMMIRLDQKMEDNFRQVNDRLNQLEHNTEFKKKISNG